jgi:hypothetical protein
MTDVEQLITRIHAYCRAADRSPSTISRKLLGNGKRLSELEAGKSLRVDTLAKAQELLSQLEAAA